jgi:hypothetical protein
MNYRNYCLVSGVLFSLIASVHLLRIIYGVSVDVDGTAIPVALSWFGLLVPGALACWAFGIVRRPAP